jgi:hypothetical protein
MATTFKRGSVNPNLIPQMWSKDDFKMAFNANPLSPFMGADENCVIQIMPGLDGRDKKGDKITWALVGLDNSSGQGDDGDYEGNEAGMTFYEDSIQIHERGHSQKINGKMTEKSAYDNLRPKARRVLSDWVGRVQAADIISAASGLATTAIMGKATGALAVATGSTNKYIETVNATPIVKGQTALRSFIGGQTTAGVVTRVANHSEIATTATNFLMGTQVIERVRRMAQEDYYINTSGEAVSISPIRPIMINGKAHYLLLVDKLQIKALRKETAFLNALTYAADRGKENPLFYAVDYIWNNVLIKETELLHKRTGTGATSDLSLLRGEWFEGLGTGGVATTADRVGSGITVCRSLFLGAQAVGLAWGQKPTWSGGYSDSPHNTKFVEHTDMIYGVKKATFAIGDGGANIDYGCITVDTAVVLDSTDD